MVATFSDAKHIRVRIVKRCHPFVDKLLDKGAEKLAQLQFQPNDPRANIYRCYERKLRWIGAFIGAVNVHPNLEEIADACLILSLTELHHESELSAAKQLFSVNQDLLTAVNALWKMLEPITKRRGRSQSTCTRA